MPASRASSAMPPMKVPQMPRMWVEQQVEQVGPRGLAETAEHGATVDRTDQQAGPRNQ
jgi:hypothetical protein